MHQERVFIASVSRGGALSRNVGGLCVHVCARVLIWIGFYPTGNVSGTDKTLAPRAQASPARLRLLRYPIGSSLRLFGSPLNVLPACCSSSLETYHSLISVCWCSELKWKLDMKASFLPLFFLRCMRLAAKRLRNARTHIRPQVAATIRSMLRLSAANGDRSFTLGSFRAV